MSRHKDKYEPSNPRRSHTFMPLEEVNAGKKSQWMELEITGNVLHRYIWQAYVHHNLIITFPFQVLYETSVPTCGSCSIWRLSTWTTTTWLESHQRSAASHAWSNWIFLATSFVTCHLRLGSWWLFVSSYCTTTTSGPFLWRWVNSSSYRSSDWRAIHSRRISWPCSARSTGLTKFCPTYWTIYPVSPHMNTFFSIISLSFSARRSCCCHHHSSMLWSHDSSSSPLDLNNGWLILRAWWWWYGGSAGQVVTSIAFSRNEIKEPSDMLLFFWAPFNKEKGENTFVDSYNIGSDSTFQFFIIKICFFSRRRRLPMLVKRHENDDQHVCIFICTVYKTY